ncbi:hypothetical protein [Azospirillum sp. TSO5]|uniref:hypothetical protein n=1 Tax=Azospirillum sp. TSO5 TaxID=716760 RepID=UPI000D60E1E9|nr:hypothetical protein [Azospirillum sp. TSO5]PWC92874.1 hypothetical protein TSO5_15700 [Azospirillum sp. TSO5]
MEGEHLIKNEMYPKPMHAVLPYVRRQFDALPEAGKRLFFNTLGTGMIPPLGYRMTDNIKVFEQGYGVEPGEEGKLPRILITYTMFSDRSGVSEPPGSFVRALVEVNGDMLSEAGYHVEPWEAGRTAMSEPEFAAEVLSALADAADARLARGYTLPVEAPPEPSPAELWAGEVGEVPEGGPGVLYRVVWQRPDGDAVAGNPLSEVGFESDAEGLEGVHVTTLAGAREWFSKLVEDYDREPAAWLVRIDRPEGSVLVGDPQFAIPDERMALPSWVLVAEAGSLRGEVEADFGPEDLMESAPDGVDMDPDVVEVRRLLAGLKEPGESEARLGEALRELEAVRRAEPAEEPAIAPADPRRAVRVIEAAVRASVARTPSPPEREAARGGKGMGI